MAIEPIKIPQDVHIEDKIIGPITLRQLTITLIGGGISYAIWGAMKNEYGGGVPLDRTIMAWTPCVIAAAFAFIRINNVSLARFCLLLIEKTDKPAIRSWHPREGISINVRTFEDTKKKPTKDMPDKTPAELSTVLDTGMDHLAEVVEQQMQQQKAASLPVRPERVQVDERTSPSIDDVQESQAQQLTQEPNDNGPILRDLSPKQA